MTLRQKSKRQNAAAQPAKFGIDHFFSRHRASQIKNEAPPSRAEESQGDGPSLTSSEEKGSGDENQSKRIRLSPLLLQTQTQDDGTDEVIWKGSPTAERLHEQEASPAVRERRLALRPCQTNVCKRVSPSSKISPGIAGKLEHWLRDAQADDKENVAFLIDVKTLKTPQEPATSRKPSKTLSVRARKREFMQQAQLGPHRKVLLQLLDQVQTAISQDKSVEEISKSKFDKAETTSSVDQPTEDIATKLASLGGLGECEDTADCAKASTTTTPCTKDGGYLVLEVSDQVYLKNENGASFPEKVLRLLDENNAAEKFVHLRDEWFFSTLKPGDTINVVGEFQPDSKCIVDHEQNLLVIHPEVLISGSKVGSSFICPRRAVLDERIKSCDVSLAALLGTMLHRLFQTALFDKEASEKYLQNRAKEIVLDSIDGLYAIGADESEALGKLTEAIPVMLRWLHAFRHPTIQTAMEPNVDFGVRNGKRRIAVSEIVDIEEMILSPKYGLKGMIDASVLVSSEEAESKPMPLEFKTGKATTGQAATEHRAQVILYTLLMSDRYSEDVNEGLIYYLHTDETQGVSVQHSDLTGLLMRRNEHAGSLLSASLNQTLPPMLQNPHICRGCRVVDSCSVYHKALEGGTAETSGLGELYGMLTNHLSRRHVEFLRHWDRLIDLENQISQSTQSEVWRMPSSQREEHGRCLSSMVLQPENDISTGKPLYVFTKSVSNVPATRSLQDTFVCGDCVLLSTESGHTAVAGGIITRTNPSSVTVAMSRPLRLPGKHSSDAIKRELWRIDKDDRGSSFATMRYNLLQLFVKDGATHTRQLVVDLEAPRFESYIALSQDPAALYTRSARELNIDQRNAIEKILTAGDYALILGMPGTGKTSTIVHAVQALLARGASILLASYTNSAVDNILLKLKSNGVPFVRVGRSEAIHPELAEYALNVGVTSVEGLRSKIGQAQVVGATCFGVTSALFVNRKFDVCIIDEAGQITLPVCLGPLRYARTFVLVGDHYQLPPLVQNPEAREKGMAISLFRRLSEAHPSAVSALQYQYRMCADIMNLSNNLIYGHRLRCGSDAIATARLEVSISKTLPTWTQQVLDPNRKILFLDTDAICSEQKRSSHSLVQNITESSIAMKIICSFKVGGVDCKSMGVISPYKAQVDYIMQRLAEKDLSGVEVHTIDKYQGRDKDCILVSFVKSKAQRISGSLLTDWHRINVAITRAKKKMIFIGSSKTLSSVPLLKLLIEQVDAQGGLLALPEDTLTFL